MSKSTTWKAGTPHGSPRPPADVLDRKVDPGEWAPEPYGWLDGPIYVHLDLDVLDPAVLPSQFPVSGGLSAEQLRGVLASLDGVVGVEVTAFEFDAEKTELMASIVRTLL